MNVWNLLPAGIAARAKALLAVIGGAAYIVANYIPAVEHNHAVAILIAVLTALGVYVVPNGNAKTRAMDGRTLIVR